jgi:hypothetical protein
VEVPPSPNVHAYDGVPEQFVGVAVDWKGTDIPDVPFAGTVAVHDNEQAGVIEIDPLFVHVLPLTVTVKDQVYDPDPMAVYVCVGFC